MHVLTEGFAAGQGNVGVRHLFYDVVDVHVLPFRKGIGRVTVRTTQVTAAQADEGSQLAGRLPFAVDAVEDLIDTETILHK